MGRVLRIDGHALFQAIPADIRECHQEVLKARCIVPPDGDLSGVSGESLMALGYRERLAVHRAEWAKQNLSFTPLVDSSQNYSVRAHMSPVLHSLFRCSRPSASSARGRWARRRSGAPSASLACTC